MVGDGLAVTASNEATASIGWAWNTSGAKTTPNLISLAATQVDPLLNAPNSPWLILFAGTNDITYGDTAAQAYASFQTYLAARLAAGWPVARIIVCTMLPRGSAVEAARAIYNPLLVSGASTYGYKLVRLDLDPNIGQAGQNTNAEFYEQTFAIHPNIAGMTIVASDIAAVFAPGRSLTAWSSYDNSTLGGSYTISNNNLSARTTETQFWQTIRATTARFSGKPYIEFKCTAAGSDPNYAFGLAGYAYFNTSGNYLGGGYSTSYEESCGGYFNGTNNLLASFNMTVGAGTMPAANPALNDVIGVLTDFTAGNVWLARNNLNIGTGAAPNPATDPAQFTFTPATVGALFPGMTASTANANGTWTLQATASNQTYSPPSGFSAWG
jgi:lysophospholipase L1-like esterase